MDKFIEKFIYLGANLGISSKYHRYVDLESFFLESTLYLDSDNRVKQAILNWLHRYAKLLSPSKIRRLLTNSNYEEKNLNSLVSFLISNKLVKPNWNILLEKQNTPSITFRANERKYLKTNEFIMKNVPELRYRAEGRSQVISDILSFMGKSTFKSLYELAKQIHSPRNRVNESFHQLKSYGLI